MVRQFVLVGLVLTAGCATLDPDAGLAEVRSQVAERSGQQFDGRAEVAQLLAEPLDADGAVQVALLSHPRVNVLLDQLRIGEAERVQAIRLRNPTLEVQRNEFTLIQPLLDLVTLAARRNRAEAEFEAVQLEVTHELLGVITEVRDAWARTVAAGQRDKLAEDRVQAAEAALAFRVALREAGNITALELVEEQLRHQDALLAFELARAEWTSSRERFQLALGDVPGWRVRPRLPLPRADDELDVEQVAMDASLSLAAKRKRLASLAAAAGIADSRGWLDDLDLGLKAHRDGGDWTYRPLLEVTLPLFDTGSARRTAIHARLSQATHGYAVAVLELRADIRRLVATTRHYGTNARRYADEVIPAHDAHLEQTLRQVNAMQLGVFDLLMARQAQIAAWQQQVSALEEYWIHRNALDALLAGGH